MGYKINPMTTIIKSASITPITINNMPLPICPLYICPNPVIKNEHIAAIPGLFVVVIGFNSTLTPHFGHISALASIAAPQFEQYLVFSLSK